MSAVRCKSCGAGIEPDMDSGLLICGCLEADKLILAEDMKGEPPRKGDEITYRSKPYGVAVRTEGNLCWVTPYSGAETNPFIWRFKDGLNNLHDWSGKQQ